VQVDRSSRRLRLVSSTSLSTSITSSYRWPDLSRVERFGGGVCLTASGKLLFCDGLFGNGAYLPIPNANFMVFPNNSIC
jgi:hypothetical protein